MSTRNPRGSEVQYEKNTGMLLNQETGRQTDLLLKGGEQVIGAELVAG